MVGQKIQRNKEEPPKSRSNHQKITLHLVKYVVIKEPSNDVVRSAKTQHDGQPKH